MADMQEIYDAIRVADAAGDTDSVIRLGDYIKQTGTMPSVAEVPEPQPEIETETEDPWLGKRISEDLGIRAEKVKGLAGETSLLHAPFVVGVAAGQLAGGVGDIIGETIQSTYKTIVPEEKQEEVKSAFKSLAETPLGKAGLYALREGGVFYSKFKEANPEAALALESGTNLVALGAGTGAVKATRQKITALRQTPVKLTREFKNVVSKGINKGIRPTVVGKKTFSQVKKFDEQAADAVEAIIDNKQNLKLADDLGFTAEGKLPENLRDFSQSVEQTKRQIFKEYDDMAKASLETIDDATTAALYKGKRVNPVELRNELDRLGTQITNEQAKAGQINLVDAAQEHLKSTGQAWAQVVGETPKSYNKRIISAYKQDVPEAVAKAGTSKEVAKLTARKEQITEILDNLTPEQAMVNLNSVSDELAKIADNKVLRDNAPEAAQYAKDRMKAFTRRGQYTTDEAQEAVKILNQSLESFYKNPTYDAASKAYIDSLVANNIRQSLDDVITNATGPGYRELKKQYGALKSLEKDINHRMVVDARKNQKRLIDFTDVLTGDRAVQGIMTMNPVAIGQATFIKAIAAHIKRLNDPNRIIKNMFKQADKIKSLPNYVQKVK